MGQAILFDDAFEPAADRHRLAALDRYDVLDSGREEAFDRIARLIKLTLGVEVGIVSLMDAHRQWYKAVDGFSTTEVPLQSAFCKHLLADPTPIVVPDATLDERFRDNVAVTGEPAVRFYAGQPVHSLDGQPLGTLCIADTRPREFGLAERRMLRDLARMVQDELNRDVVVAARDAAQQSLRELNAQLEQRVLARTRELHAKNAALEQEVGQRVAAEHKLRLSETRIRSIIDTSLAAFVGIGEDNRVQDWNPAAERLFGWSRADAMGQLLAELIIPERYRAAHDAGFARFAATGEGAVLGQRLELPALGRDGRERMVEMSINAFRVEGRLFAGAFLHDISDRIAAEQALRHERELLIASRARVVESEEWLRTIADNVPALIAYVDTGLRYRFANERYREWFGVRSEHMLGRSVPEAMGEAFFAPRRAALERCLAGHASHLEIEEQRRGRTRVISSTYLPHLRDGVVQGIYVLSTDATSAREYERQLHALAHSDHLTGLPNRRSYEERLAQAVARSRRSAMPLALAYLDVDHFKQINDSLGHAVGDAVLREFARRLSATVRSTDTVARLAGDEFVIVLEQVGSPLECERIAAKLLEAVRPPFELEGRTLQVTSSMGIAWCARPDQAALAHAADSALYQSKRAGRDTASVLTVGSAC